MPKIPHRNVSGSHLDCYVNVAQLNKDREHRCGVSGACFLPLDLTAFSTKYTCVMMAEIFFSMVPRKIFTLNKFILALSPKTDQYCIIHRIVDAHKI